VDAIGGYEYDTVQLTLVVVTGSKRAAECLFVKRVLISRPRKTVQLKLDT